MKDYKNVTIFDHPLIRHKIAILRDVTTSTKEFRELVEEITTLMVYESFKNVPTKKVMVQTPLELTEQTMVADDAVAVIPILRAGLGMVNGVHTLFPTAKVGHIGICRDEQTLEPHEYYCNLPDGIENSFAILLDPMLATGGSAVAAIKYLKLHGCKKIMLMSIVGVPQGVARVAETYPDVEVYVSTLDRELNERGYILPGLGDAGDRLFGTK
ncbi:MAG: uracil phosphoribosyltransferase [Clostridia bacterium]